MFRRRPPLRAQYYRIHPFTAALCTLFAMWIAGAVWLGFFQSADVGSTARYHDVHGDVHHDANEDFEQSDASSLLLRLQGRRQHEPDEAAAEEEGEEAQGAAAPAKAVDDPWGATSSGHRDKRAFQKLAARLARYAGEAGTHASNPGDPGADGDAVRVALVAYLPRDRPHQVEHLLFFLVASWQAARHVHAANARRHGPRGRVTVDLRLFHDPDTAFPAAAWADTGCVAAPLNDENENNSDRSDRSGDGDASRCYTHALAIDHARHDWIGKEQYGFQNSISFLTYARVQAFLLSLRYDLLLKSDVDVFFAPRAFEAIARTFGAEGHGGGGARKKRPFMVMGTGNYGSEFASQRLLYVAETLGLRHRGHTDLGSSWLGKPRGVFALANLTDAVATHLMAEEFDKRKPGLRRLWKKWKGGCPQPVKGGCGHWNEWWRTATTLHVRDAHTSIERSVS